MQHWTKEKVLIEEDILQYVKKYTGCDVADVAVHFQVPLMEASKLCGALVDRGALVAGGPIAGITINHCAGCKHSCKRTGNVSQLWTEMCKECRRVGERVNYEE